MDIRGKHVLLTGATSGIGKHAAHLLAAKGAELTIVSRTEENLKDTARELEERHGCTVHTLCLDLADTVSTTAAFSKYCVAHPVDIAVIVHGIGQYGRFSQTSWTDIEPILRTNIDGALATAHSVLPGMIERRRGSIVFISSILGKRALPNNTAYSATKFALQGAAEALRLETRRFGVHIGIVAPSRTTTPFAGSMKYSEQHARPVVQIASSPERVAKSIIRCIEKERREIVVSVSGKLYAYLGYHFPRISDWVLSWAVPEPGDGSAQ